MNQILQNFQIDIEIVVDGDKMEINISEVNTILKTKELVKFE